MAESASVQVKVADFPEVKAALAEAAGLVRLLDAALSAIVLADSLDQAQGIAHAALHREEYHGNEAS